jgi:hypothetical protein
LSAEDKVRYERELTAFVAEREKAWTRDPSVPPTSPPFVAVFNYYDGGAPALLYLHLTGNEEAVQRLSEIASDNNDEEFTVRVFHSQPLPADAVNEMRQAQGQAEQLRELLQRWLPEGPAGAGWVDSEQWSVEEVVQQVLPGRLELLPRDRPASIEFDNYAVQVMMIGNLDRYVHAER